MTTALITHARCLDHVTPQGHPERVARLQAINTALAAPEFAPLHRVEALPASDDALRLAHPADYITSLQAKAPTSDTIAIDADTFMSPGSLDAATLAAGALPQAVDLVMSGTVKNAFCAIRPPGHHAETRTAMGFCFFGNVVIGARHALRSHNLDRVAIIDFDVHHGNGTQDLVWNDPQILFVSTHQMPLYPGSGLPSETGAHDNILNLPLNTHDGSQAFRDRITGHALPAVVAFDPQMIFISAGFDAHRADPLANLNLTEDDFAWATHQICDLADANASGRVVSTLEGGYDLDALAASTAAHVKVLMERGQ